MLCTRLTVSDFSKMKNPVIFASKAYLHISGIFGNFPLDFGRYSTPYKRLNTFLNIFYKLMFVVSSVLAVKETIYPSITYNNHFETSDVPLATTCVKMVALYLLYHRISMVFNVTDLFDLLKLWPDEDFTNR